jgi:hypothetical protein
MPFDQPRRPSPSIVPMPKRVADKPQPAQAQLDEAHEGHLWTGAVIYDARSSMTNHDIYARALSSMRP